MIKSFISALLICAAARVLVAQSSSGVLARRYVEGEKLTYHMTGINENWRYEIKADGIVKKAPDGTYFEEYGWSDMISDGKKFPLPPSSANFRQEVSLDPNHKPSFPNLGQVHPALIGPLTDFLNFYVDVWMAVKTGKLTKKGDHVYVKNGVPSPWADGVHVLRGESSIDFDFTLQDINQADGTITLLARHVPPEKQQISMPAEWMNQPVADTPNNWMELEKTNDGKFIGAVGKEIFNVEIKLSLADGKILSVVMDNPVQTIERECADQALTNCGDPKPHLIKRQIEMSLVR